MSELVNLATEVRDAITRFLASSSPVPTPAPAPAPIPTPTPAPDPATKPWLSAYYTEWRARSYPLTSVDKTGVTHMFLAFGLPMPDGTIEGPSVAFRKKFVTEAHSAGLKAIFSIGGAGTIDNFRQAIRTSTIVASIQNVMAEGFDGVDIDFEPLRTSDLPSFTAFLQSLRSRLQPTAIITAAVGYDEATKWASLSQYFDQINLMAYDFAGPWEGWCSWHQAPLYTGGRTLPGGNPLPSVAVMAKKYIDAGIPKSKIGLGLTFNMTLWTGVGDIMQPIAGKNVTTTALSPLNFILSPDYVKHYDSLSSASYSTTQSSMLSYEDIDSCRAKALYAASTGLGGVMVWDIVSGQAAGSNVLLRALS